MALVVAGCGSDDGDVVAGSDTTAPSTVPPGDTTSTTLAPTTTGAPSSCDTEGWQTFENSAFSFRAPADVVDQEPQGIDSLVGEYEGGGLLIAFDFGWYSTDFADLGEHSTSEDLVLDGFDARLIHADIDGVEGYAGYEAAFLAALHVGDVEVTQEGGSTSLAMYVTFDDSALAPTAECILKSVDFSL